MEKKKRTDNEKINAALEEVVPEDLPELNEEEEGLFMGSNSRVLDGLDKPRLLKVKTVCARCPHSVWHKTPKDLKCYCRVMYVISWSTDTPNQITACDGMFLEQ
jgi:hypothetical protein